MNNDKHLFPFVWKLSDGYPAKNIDYHGKTVFGTFICGGGSTMGYKLSGFKHLGGVELDPKVADTYSQNHHPKYMYNMDIRDFNAKMDIPSDLYDLDLLDGSPPCSTFSTSGSREDAWGKMKKFAEGQKMQTLDDLVFVYCDTIKKLMPKVCLLENVSGLIKGNGKVYCKKIVQTLERIGYRPQVFLLNAARMGVPQKRERVFIIGLRNDFKLPKLQLNFDEPPIPFELCDDGDTPTQHKIAPCDLPYYRMCKQGEGINKHHPKGHRFNSIRLSMKGVCNTVASASCLYHPLYERALNDNELIKIGTFPSDYKFNERGAQWYIGMSVPPIMTAQIAHQIYVQWLSKI